VGADPRRRAAALPRARARLSETRPRGPWRRAWTLFCDAAVAGGRDPGYGSRLLGDLQALDVVGVEASVIIPYTPGGSVPAPLFAGSLERLSERMLALGATEVDLTTAPGLQRDPSVTYRGVTLTTAWARRPD
jgi:hypothetical protein